ncbi:hypothetical protein J2767_003571 [Agrobacterium tumefaciens]|uniref:hypothetical protein n=1 Tax=Agrobacterium tumefaciens TaxID=358 RepID=UPI001AEA6711|nr:hypothetical protein [Agrobacterium tumefaciens]MBP2572393.1 hypothetical protein [Agrobacterium tumefaciens]
MATTVSCLSDANSGSIGYGLVQNTISTTGLLGARSDVSNSPLSLKSDEYFSLRSGQVLGASEGANVGSNTGVSGSTIASTISATPVKSEMRSLETATKALDSLSSYIGPSTSLMDMAKAAQPAAANVPGPAKAVDFLFNVRDAAKKAEDNFTFAGNLASKLTASWAGGIAGQALVTYGAAAAGGAAAAPVVALAVVGAATAMATSNALEPQINFAIRTTTTFVKEALGTAEDHLTTVLTDLDRQIRNLYPGLARP